MKAKIILTEDQKTEIINRYLKGEKVTVLVKDYGYKYNNHGTILDLLRRNGVKIRNDQQTHAIRYTINENYFEKIDTEAKAYFLGLLYADGCNSTEKNTVRIQLQEEDVHILRKFNEELNHSKPLKFWKSNNPNRKSLYTLNITNKKISLDLLNLGLTKAKTHTLQFPNKSIVPNKLLKHFVRGYFDGDGSIYYSIDKKWGAKRFAFAIVGNLSFIDKLQDFIVVNTGLNKTKLGKRHKSRNNNIAHLEYGGTNSVMKFYTWLYKDATIFFKRKYEKFQGVFK